MSSAPEQPDSANPWLADGRDALVRDAVAGWQRHLVDLGGRNSLLWFRDLPDGTLDLTRAHPAGIARLFSTGSVALRDLLREPVAFADAARRARTIRIRSQELAEERGIATCYLAIGIATWSRGAAGRAPAAPVLLRRCEIVAGSGGADDLVLHLSETAEFNTALAKYLQVECGIELDEGLITAQPTGGSGAQIDAVLDAVARACADVPGFAIQRRYVVGTFSYTKLPMVRDLSEQLDQLSEHPVIAALAGDEAAREEVSADAAPAPDLEPDQERLVLDADASQQDVVHAVRAGAHLVVQGPPGTGKSQTIANLIAALTADGRRVLFVAEKRAAIDAVVKRLAQVGLEDLVYDVGARSAEAPAAGFVSTMDDAVTADVEAPEVDPTLGDQRAVLSGHHRGMHAVHPPWGVTADQAQTRLTQLHATKPTPRSRATIGAEDLEAITPARRDELQRELTDVARLGAWRTDEQPDPWFGARVLGSTHAAQAAGTVHDLADGGLAGHRLRFAELTQHVGLPEPRTFREGEDQLELMARVHLTLESFRPEIFDAPLDDLVSATGSGDYRSEHHSSLGLVERRRLKRQARALLRPGQPPADLHGVLALAATQRRQWREFAGKGSRPSAPPEVAQLRADHEKLREELEWLAARLEGTAEGNDLLEQDLDALQSRLETLDAAQDRLAVVPTVIGRLDRLRENGLGDLLDDLSHRRVTASQAATEFEFVWWRSVLARIDATDPAYGEMDGAALRAAAQTYAATDAEHIRAGAARVRKAWFEQIRRTVRELPDQEELLRAAAAAERPVHLRDLLPQASELLTALAPCWAMSPLVVASVVPPGVWFDVVVFDEASQIPPAEAVSAISRAGQVVVAGDPRQLPPTTFFRGADQEPGDMTGDAAESVLDALSPLLPNRELTWHYRALDERLIAFANTQIYGGHLVTFPGVGEDTVVRLDVVDTGSAQAADAEVERVVQVVLAHARQRPEESIGVIALGRTHAARIDSAIRAAAAKDSSLAALIADPAAEPFFVKNLERVQGDERDAIVLSIGHDRAADGTAPHRFGPISAEGGERRLNVAITRARRRMVVVSAFSGKELHPGRLRSRGGLMLRDFLLYAGSGGAARRVKGSDHEVAAETGSEGASAAPGRSGVVRGPDGRRRRAASTGSVLDRPVLPLTQASTEGEVPPLVLDLARRLRAEGLVVHPGWGVSSHRLDLAIEDPRQPGSLLVAVETDGPIYGAITSTRDRERLRVEQLRRLGWVHERVWTRDLYRDPAREVARLLTAVHAASQERQQADRLESAGSRAANPWLDEQGQD